mmetsp:Transcript_52468/g.77689  ORF Transcript_52468/g.77689 Transcript_52468/m.77689 type:complete len:267 (-) Transcript_52468:2304-3104(-)
MSARNPLHSSKQEQEHISQTPAKTHSPSLRPPGRYSAQVGSNRTKSSKQYSREQMPSPSASFSASYGQESTSFNNPSISESSSIGAIVPWRSISAENATVLPSASRRPEATEMAIQWAPIPNAAERYWLGEGIWESSSPTRNNVVPSSDGKESSSSANEPTPNPGPPSLLASEIKAITRSMMAAVSSALISARASGHPSPSVSTSNKNLPSSTMSGSKPHSSNRPNWPSHTVSESGSFSASKRQLSMSSQIKSASRSLNSSLGQAS